MGGVLGHCSGHRVCKPRRAGRLCRAWRAARFCLRAGERHQRRHLGLQSHLLGVRRRRDGDGPRGAHRSARRPHRRLHPPDQHGGRRRHAAGPLDRLAPWHEPHNPVPLPGDRHPDGRGVRRGDHEALSRRLSSAKGRPVPAPGDEDRQLAKRDDLQVRGRAARPRLVRDHDAQAHGPRHRHRAGHPACAPRAEDQHDLPGAEGSHCRHEDRRLRDRHRPPPGSLRFQPRRLRRVSYRALVRRRRHFLLALEFHHETQGHARAGGHGQHVADRRRPDRRRGARVPLAGHHRPRFARARMSPFRTSYLRYEELTRIVHEWARAQPEIVRVASLGKSPEGRDLWLLEIGADPDRLRAAAWVDGNMHASEVCGASVALAIAEDVIALHRGADQLDLPVHVKERLKSVLFYVLPRMSPDGAEAVLRDGRFVRSNPRDRRPHPPVARWVSGDVDGDGRVLSLRRQDPSGEYVEDPDLPGVMLPRRLEDAGPYYKLWPEGTIENFDGTHVPDPHFLSANDVDLTRNFPHSWKPEPEQVGAGPFGASEPESRAVIEWATAHPNIFSWLNLHTFGGVYIRPLGKAPDTKMNQSDLALYRQIGEWGEKIGGYPMVSGFEQFIYEPEKPIYGDLTDFAYHVRGAIAYACELWDLFARLGIERKKPFVDHYTHLTRENLLALAKLDREQNQGRIFRGWKPWLHPQLGEVELSGGCSIDARDARLEVGHLEGWGRGLYAEFIFYLQSRGSVSRRTVSLPVRGSGRLRVRAKGLRVGEVVKEIAVGA